MTWIPLSRSVLAPLASGCSQPCSFSVTCALCLSRVLGYSLFPSRGVLSDPHTRFQEKTKDQWGLQDIELFDFGKKDIEGCTNSFDFAKKDNLSFFNCITSKDAVQLDNRKIQDLRVTSGHSPPTHCASLIKLNCSCFVALLVTHHTELFLLCCITSHSSNLVVPALFLFCCIICHSSH